MGKKARRAQAARSGTLEARPAAPDVPPDPRAWTTADRRYWPAAVVVAALGAALRLYDLAGPAFQHDEAIYSLFARGLADYKFDPVYHGPTLYYLVKAFFLVLGDSDFSARLVSVVMGLVLFGLVLGPARRFLGDRGALFALAFYAVSPVMVAYQRRILFDALVVVLTFGTVLLFQKTRASRAGSVAWYAAWMGLAALMAAFLATKANSFFVIAMLGSLFVADRLRGRPDLGVRLPTQLPLTMFGAVTAASIVWAPRFPDDMARTRLHERLLLAVCVAASALLWEWLRRTGSAAKKAPAGPRPVAHVVACAVLSTAAAGLVYAFFFGHGHLLLGTPGEWSFARYWPDVRGAMGKMLDYWVGQQKTPRLPGRHDFYLPLMIAYELPILVAFVGGVVRASRHRAPFTDLLLWWAFTSWTLYAMANEKVPWLMIHLTAPFALLGGWWLAQLRPRRPVLRRALAAAAALGAGFLLRNVSATSYERAVDHREPMFYAFTPESFKDVMLHAIEATRGKPGELWIYNPWPPSWYTRRSVEELGAVTHYPPLTTDEPPAVPLRLVIAMRSEWERYGRQRFPGWPEWTWDPEAERVVPEGGEGVDILNWPRLSWSSFRPDLFARWFFAREADLPPFPPPPDHGFSTNPSFLTEWSAIPVVVATAP